jgi:pimeloyl-ACP methyl ester carboxylesterase
VVLVTAADGTRLYYEVTGQGPPLVLVGGKTSTIAGAWWRHIPVLSRHFRVIALDNRGAGQSDKPDRPYTTRLLAEDALAVLTATGERSAHWFGISLGGMILQELALGHPEAVRSLILGATHCGPPAALAPLSAPDAERLQSSPLKRLANLYAVDFLLTHAEWVAEDATRFGKMPLFAIHRQDQAVHNHDTCRRLSEIRCPVLILHGTQDRLVPRASAEQLHNGIRGSRLVLLEGAGHQLHSERADEVDQLVIDFISKVEDTGKDLIRT